MRLSSRNLISLAVLGVCALMLLFGASGARAGMNSGRTDPTPKITARGPEPTYEIAAGLDGDVFPVFANHASFQAPQQRTWGTVTVTVANSGSELLRSRISVQIPGWSDQEIQIAEVAAGQVRKFLFAPSFLPRLYGN